MAIAMYDMRAMKCTQSSRCTAAHETALNGVLKVNTGVPPYYINQLIFMESG